MTIYKMLAPEFFHEYEFPRNTIILTLNNGIQIACANFNVKRSGKLPVYVYAQGHLVKTLMHNAYTEILWNYHRKTQKSKSKNINYKYLMKHDRKHKHSSGGSRIYNGSITDYECTKNPLHDFRRCYN